MAKVLVLLAPGFEEVEAVTVIDLLRRAEISVTVAGLKTDQIEGSHKIEIKTDANFQDIDPEDYDVLVLPGGQPGTYNLASNAWVIETIRAFDRQKKLIAAICAAPTVLNKSGILKNRRVTSFPSEKDFFNRALIH